MKTASWLPVICLALVSGCGSSPWKREAPPLYFTPGLVLYREHKEVEGLRVPLGYKHPADLPLEKAVLFLNQLVFRDDFILTSKNTYVLTQEEIRKAAEPLSVALKALGPDDRLRFLVLHDTLEDVLLGPHGTTGVIFSTQGGVLSFAFDKIHERVTVPDGGEPMKIPFRREPTEVTEESPILPGPGMKIHADPDGTQYTRWVEVTIAEVKPLPPPTQPQATTPAPVPPVRVAVPDRPPLPGSPASSAPSDEERYQQVRKQLEKLNRLRKDGAITEEQFQAEYAKAMAELK